MGQRDNPEKGCSRNDWRQNARQVKLTGYKLLLAALFVYATLFVGLKSRPMDFHVYYCAAERLRDGGDIYKIGPEGAFSYPPFAAWVCVPLTVLPLRAAQWGWALLQGAALVLVVHLSARLSRPAWQALSSTQLRWFIALVAVMAVRHLHAPLESSQTDLMITAMCLAGVWCLQREGMEWWSCLPLAAAVGMKAAPLLFVPFLMRWRRWRAAVATVAVVIVFNVMPSVQFPGASGRWHWREWVDSMASPAVQSGPAAARAGVWRADEEFNQSLGGTFNRYFIKGCYSADALLVRLDKRSVHLIFAGVTLVLMGIAMFVRQGRWYGLGSPPVRPGSVDAAVVMMLILLLSPKTSKAHYCSMLLPVMLLTADAVCAPKSWKRIFWLILGLAIGVMTKDVVGRKAGNWLLDYGYLVWFALAVLGFLWLRRSESSSD